MDRREFVQLLAIAAAGGFSFDRARASSCAPYDAKAFGNVRLLHITDTHAQLTPIYFREPSVNIGVGEARNRLPHLVGRNLLDHLSCQSSPREIHAYTNLEFVEAAEKFGRVGGYAHLKTLIDRLREEAGAERTLLMDGGDTWQGSGTALWTRGQDMVRATNLLGVDVMTGHWEFTYREDETLSNVDAFDGDFVAQNVFATEDALFEGVPVHDEDSGHVFPPYVVKTLGPGTQPVRVAVIGQAFPYTPIANPRRFIPNWSFGIRESELAEQVEAVREAEKPDLVVLLSHNGMDVDLKLASRVPGIDIIFGGHTHDGVPVALPVKNSGGRCLVTNAGSNGKFVGVMDLVVSAGSLQDFRYRLLPVFADQLPADAEMQKLIEDIRAPYSEQLGETLARTASLLYRRGNFNGSFDQLICQGLTEVLDAQIALSPGFRWGTSILPGQDITMERLLDQTAMTYPETYVRDMSGEELKVILESVADNLFHPDPYLQQGGDMVRVGGMNYTCEPLAASGQRISEMRLNDGTLIQADRSYRVAGWATVGSQAPGRPVFEVVADYLRDRKSVNIGEAQQPRIVGLKDNKGLVA